jgi:hypothetical protein
MTNTANPKMYLKPGSFITTVLMERLSNADCHERSVRFDTGVAVCPSTKRLTPFIKFKIGEDMWSPPYFSDEDPKGE